MTLVWLLVGLVIPIVTGRLLLGLLIRVERKEERVLLWGMAVATGIALHSIWFLLTLALTGGRPSRMFGAGFDVALPLLLYALRKSRGPVRPLTRRIERLGRVPLLCAIALATIGVGLGISIYVAGLQPYGGSDAWQVWNFKARWLALAGERWMEILNNPALVTAQHDYPLLVPLSIARLWSLMGTTDTIVQQTIYIGAGALTVALLISGVWAARGPVAAAVAAAGLSTMPSFFVAAATQIADVPVGCLYLCSLIALTAGLRRDGDPRWVTIAGLAAGAAMWAKNDGILFAVTVVACTMLAHALAREPGRIAATISRFLVGTAPFLLAIVALKSIARGNQMLDGFTAADALHRLADSSRHVDVLSYGLTMATRLPDHVGLALLTLFVALRFRSDDVLPALTAMSAVALTALGYYLVFVVTPFPLSWHLETAADRLLIQLWPVLVFAAMMLVRDDERVAGALRPRAALG